MTQFDFGTIDPFVIGGVTLTSWINQWRDAVHSLHRGPARPAYVVPGMMWVNDAGGDADWIVNFYTGPTIGDLPMWHVNTTTGAITHASGTVGGDLNVNGILRAVAAVPAAENSNRVPTTSWVRGLIGGGAPAVTRLLSGSGTYNTPAGAKWLRARMVGGGGGSGAAGTSAGNGGAGGDTSFNGIVAKGGSGGLGANSSTPQNTGGAGGTGGAGTASLRVAGQNGGDCGYYNGASSNTTTPGGDSAFFGGGAAPIGMVQGVGRNGVAGITNTGGGATGGLAPGTSVTGASGGGGESVELIIDAPGGGYSYIVGAGGSAGTGNAANGAAGGSGVVVVEAHF